MGNYRAFIAAADALLAIRDEVSSIDNHLESLVLLILDSSYLLILLVCLLNFMIRFGNANL